MPGPVEPAGATGGFFGVGLGLGGIAVGVAVAAAPPAPDGVVVPVPVLGGFFVSTPALLAVAPGVALPVGVADGFDEFVAGAVVPAPAAGGFNVFTAGAVVPVPAAVGFNGVGVGFAAAAPLSGGFWTVVTGFCSVAAPAGLGVLTGVGDGVAPGAPVVVPPGTFGALGSCLGMLGSLCERMSAARMGADPVAVCVSSAILVMTRTSSSLLRSAAGLILMAKKGSLSLSGVDEITVPTAYPLG